MERRNLKRFITGFLVLAIIAGSLSLVFSSFYDRPSGTTASNDTSADTGAVPKIGDTALTETLPTDSQALTYDVSQPYTPTANPTDNFTDNFVNEMAYSLVKANPAGPSATSGMAVPPDLSDSVQNYMQDVALSPVLYPIDASRINVQKKYSSQDISNYLAGVDTIFGSASGADGIGKLLKNASSSTPDPDTITASSFVFAKSEEDLYALPVPAPMLDLHKSLLTYLELHKQIANVDYLNDPMKALAYAGKFPTLETQEQQRVGVQLDRMQQNLPTWLADASDHPSPADAARMALGIPTAHAFFAIVHDPLHTIETVFNGMGIYGSWGEMITEYLRRLATQILKDQIIHRLVQQTIQWAQNGYHGSPAFVTNWHQFLNDSFDQAAGAAIGQITPRLCSGFRPFVVSILTQGPGPQASGYNRFNCSLSQVVNTIQGFYGDFTQGGWIQFANAQQQQNNVWGAIALSVQNVAQQASDAAQTSQQEAQTSKGFLPTKSCVKYDTKTVSENTLDDYKTQPNYAGLVRCYDTNGSDPTQCIDKNTGERIPDCKDKTTSYKVCDIKLCQAGGEQITTPGDAVAQQVSLSLNAETENIISAQDLTSLVSVMINSAINRLIQVGEKGLLGLFTGSDKAGQPGTGSTGGTSGSGTSTTTTDDPKDVDAQRQQVLRLASSYEDRLDQASSTLAKWDDLAAGAKGDLSAAGAACTNRTEEASARSTTIDALADHVAADRTELAQLTSELATVKQDILDAATFLDLSNAADELNAMNDNITTLATRVTLRSGQVTQVQADAQANTQNNACSTPLSPIDDQ